MKFKSTLIKYNPFRGDMCNSEEEISLITASYRDDTIYMYMTINTGAAFTVVNFIRKFHATNSISSGFNKRGGPQRKDEILISRYIDRSIRPILDLTNKPMCINIQVFEIYDKEITDDQLKVYASNFLSSVLQKYKYLDADINTYSLDNGDGVFSVYKNNLINMDLCSGGIETGKLINNIRKLGYDKEIQISKSKSNNIRPSVQEYIRLWQTHNQSNEKKIGFEKFFANSRILDESTTPKYFMMDNLMHYCYCNKVFPGSLRNIHTTKNYKFEQVSFNSLIIKKGEADEISFPTKVCVYGKLNVFDLGDSQIIDHPSSNTKATEPFIVQYYYNDHLQIGSSPMRAGRREIGHGMLAQNGFSKIVNIPMANSVIVHSEILKGGGSTSCLTASMVGLLLYSYRFIDNIVIGLGLNSCQDQDGNLDIMVDPSHIYDAFGSCDLKLIGHKEDGKVYITAAQLDVKKLNAVPINRLACYFQKFSESYDKIIQDLSYERIVRKEVSSLLKPSIVFTSDQYSKIGLFIGKKGENIKKLQIKFDAKISIVENKDGGILVIVYPAKITNALIKALSDEFQKYNLSLKE